MILWVEGKCHEEGKYKQKHLSYAERRSERMFAELRDETWIQEDQERQCSFWKGGKKYVKNSPIKACKVSALKWIFIYS